MIEKNDRELTLDELDKVTAGYPGSYEERQQILPDLSSLQEKKVEEKPAAPKKAAAPKTTATKPAAKTTAKKTTTKK